MGELLFAGGALAAGLALIPFGYKCIYQPLMRRQEGKEIVEQDKYSVVSQIEKEEQEIDEEGGEKVKNEEHELNRNELEYSYGEAPQQDSGVGSRIGKNLWENKVGGDIRAAKKKQPKIASVGAGLKAHEEIAAEEEGRKKQQQEAAAAATKQKSVFAQREFIKPVQPQISYSATPDLLFEPTRFSRGGQDKFVSKKDFGDAEEVAIDISKFMTK